MSRDSAEGNQGERGDGGEDCEEEQGETGHDEDRWLKKEELIGKEAIV